MSVLQGRKMRHREKRTVPQGRIPASGKSRTTPHGTVRHLQPFVLHFSTYVQQGKKFVRHKRKNNRHPGKNVHDRGTNVHHRIRCPINRGGLSNTTQFPFQSWRSSNGHADRSSGDNCFFRRGLRRCRWLSRRQALFSERSRMRDFPHGFPRPPKSSFFSDPGRTFPNMAGGPRFWTNWQIFLSAAGSMLAFTKS